MEIETIAFRIFDSNKGTDEEYLIPDTIDNQEMVFANRFTHDIRFGKMFDFQFAHEEYAPKFIEFGEVYLNAWDNSDNHLEISDVDEMVGVNW